MRVVLYTVRPPVAGVADLDELDVDRWLEASSMLDDAGIELVEWFVVGALRHLATRPARRTAALER